MYLAKFFHRSPGNDDRELLLVPEGDPIVMGIHMNWEAERGSDQYLREDFSSIEDAVSAFRRHVAELLAKGYFETDDTKYTLRKLPPDPRPKPDWQKGLDELMMTALSAPMAEQARQLEALKGTPAEHEPLYLWLAADHGNAANRDPAQAVHFAEQARDTIRARKAAAQSYYAWSISGNDLEGYILEALSDAHLQAGNPDVALQTLEHLCKIAPTHERILERARILCASFPERREDAFDDAYRWSRFGGYDDIMSFPGYADYEARRKAGTAAKGWRWKPGTPASEADVGKAEQRLGVRLSDDYRNFLLNRPPICASTQRMNWPLSDAIFWISLLIPRTSSKRHLLIFAQSTAFRSSTSCRLPSHRSSAAASCCMSSPASAMAGVSSGTMTAHGSWSSRSRASKTR